tara:strand:- start:19657 stop:20469 length:813 start_codon:yes stop_codon:yes gene_type:complete
MKKVKQKQVSQIGQAIASGKTESHLAFNKLLTLTFIALNDKKFKENVKIISYQRLVRATAKQKDPDNKARFIDFHTRPYRKMLEQFESSICEQDLSWLTNAKIDIQAGKTGNAVFPLSEVYESVLKSKKEDKIDTLEGNLFIIFKHLSDPDSETRKKLVDICSDFEDDKDSGPSQSEKALKNMTTKIQSRMQNMGNQPNEEQLMGLIKDVAGGAISGGGEGEDGGIGQFVASMMKGEMNMPDLIRSITETVNENNAASATSDEKGKEESN